MTSGVAPRERAHAVRTAPPAQAPKSSETAPSAHEARSEARTDPMWRRASARRAAGPGTGAAVRAGALPGNDSPGCGTEGAEATRSIGWRAVLFSTFRSCRLRYRALTRRPAPVPCDASQTVREQQPCQRPAPCKLACWRTFGRQSNRVRVGKGSVDVSETSAAGESSSGEQPPSPLGRRSASAEASKCALASGCAEERAMIDALLTSGEVDNPCSRAVASTGSVLQLGPSPWTSMQRSSAFYKSPRIAPESPPFGVAVAPGRGTRRGSWRNYYPWARPLRHIALRQHRTPSGDATEPSWRPQ